MRVLSRNEPLPLQNNTFREKPGIGIVFRGGHVHQPLNGQWFGPKWPTRVLHFYCPWRILPFINWRIGRTVGYVGFKAYGVDVPKYLNWIPSEHVFEGSVALSISARLDADDH